MADPRLDWVRVADAGDGRDDGRLGELHGVGALAPSRLHELLVPWLSNKTMQATIGALKQPRRESNRGSKATSEAPALDRAARA